jgi:hypothetical protein
MKLGLGRDRCQWGTLAREGDGKLGKEASPHPLGVGDARGLRSDDGSRSC